MPDDDQRFAVEVGRLIGALFAHDVQLKLAAQVLSHLTEEFYKPSIFRASLMGSSARSPFGAEALRYGLLSRSTVVLFFYTTVLKSTPHPAGSLPGGHRALEMLLVIRVIGLVRPSPGDREHT